jgi:tripartite-type tricarboxylate transporter receptor subunit TctC
MTTRTLPHASTPAAPGSVSVPAPATDCRLAIFKRARFLCACVLSILALSPALAQSWPAKPIRVLVVWPTGGSNDVAARIVIPRLAEVVGQPMVIENRGGASGIIGAEVLARLPADGYSLMVHSATHVANAALNAKLPYDTLRDFTPVATLAQQPGVLVVHPSLPVKTVADLLRLARARPGDVLYGSPGTGSNPHLSMALFQQLTDVRLLHVPYKGGGPLATALIGGEVPTALTGLASVMEFVRVKRLRPLAVTSTERNPMLPDVPTLAEAGVKGFDLHTWIGLLGPAGLPKDVVTRLNTDVARVLRSPDVVQQLVAVGAPPLVMTPEQFAERMRVDVGTYAQLVKATGARID